MPPNLDTNNPIFTFDANNIAYENTGTLTINNAGNWEAAAYPATNRVDDLQIQIDELRNNFMNFQNANVTAADIVGHFNAYYDANPVRTIAADDWHEWLHNPILHADLAEGITIYDSAPSGAEDFETDSDAPEIEPASEEELLGFLSDCGVIREAV